jgi:hypothetical protein
MASATPRETIYGAAGNWFIGSNEAGADVVLGAGVTGGAGAGAGTFVGTTSTWIVPIWRLW